MALCRRLLAEQKLTPVFLRLYSMIGEAPRVASAHAAQAAAVQARQISHKQAVLTVWFVYGVVLACVAKMSRWAHS